MPKYETLPDGHMSASSSSDMEKLTDMIHKLLNAVWGSDWGLFTVESPTGNDSADTPLPHITYNLLKREPTRDRTVKKQQFDSFPDPENEGHNITLYRQWFDCEMEFVLYAKSRLEATRLAQRFEEFMDTYVGYFKKQGIAEIIFQEENAPTVSSEYRQDIPNRTLTYLVRVERITPVRSVHLQKIEHIINLTDEEQISQDSTDSEQAATAFSSEGSEDFLNTYYKHFPK